jgi:hypothetical protein
MYVFGMTSRGIIMLRQNEKIHCRGLHNEELHNLHSSPSIIRMIKSRRMRWAGHVARMGRRGMHIEYWLESRKEGDHWEDQDVGGMVWISLIWLRIGTSGGLL